MNKTEQTLNEIALAIARAESNFEKLNYPVMEEIIDLIGPDRMWRAREQLVALTEPIEYFPDTDNSNDEQWG